MSNLGRAFVWCAVSATLLCIAATAETFRFQLADKRENVQMVRDVEVLFDKSASIELRYLEIWEWGRGEVVTTDAQIRNKWDLSFVYRCNYSCGTGELELERRLKAGRKIIGDCPVPYLGLITFRDKASRTTGEIFISHYGMCFKMNGVIYYLDPKHALDKYESHLMSLIEP